MLKFFSLFKWGSVKKRFKNVFTKKNIILGIIVLFFFFQYIQTQRVLGTFSFTDSSLVTEIGQIKEAYIKVGTDLNEVRNFLRMPTKSYGGFNEDEAVSEEVKGGDANKDELQIAMFKYVDYLAAQKRIAKGLSDNKVLLDSFASYDGLKAFLAEKGLTSTGVVEDPEGFSLAIKDADGANVVLYYLTKEDGTFVQKTADKKDSVSVKDSAKFNEESLKFVKENVDALLKVAKDVKARRTEIWTAMSSKEAQDEAKKLGITLTTDYEEKDSKIVYSIFGKDKTAIGEIVLDPKDLSITLVDKKDTSLSVQTTDIAKSLVPFMQKLDTKTFLEKKAEEALSGVKNTLNDAGFKLLLSNAGLKIAETPREDNIRVYYDISDLEGNILSSIVVEKTTGVVNIVDPKGTNSENILFFDPDFKKKTLAVPENLPEYGDTVSHADNTFNILIAGKHGSLVDTMIFAHINEDTGKIRMISIPRDLFYNGRKINAYAYFYGMPELKKVLSDITGYELDKYILIDMYAFIEVIDIIGGIDIHLDSPVIDPTYRTVDNGVEGTLHYEPGDYHLGGKEALRLARTRHTSSDFARAERQQMILKALQNKAKNFGFGDAGTIYEIAKVVLSKTETDIGLDEAIAYYFRYQNFDIESNAVMSSGNVLYVPPYITTENCNKWIEEAAAAGQPKPDCENQNNAYTLLPDGDNWNVIKWYFRENFEGM